MSVFADSSALVKLYTDEPDHQIIRSLPSLVIARLARIEVTAALWRKQRMGELSDALVRTISDEFELDYFGTGEISPRFAIVAESTPIMEDAVRITAVHDLRAYDAVQLATARAVRHLDPDCLSLAAFDKALRTAAITEGFALVPPD